MAHSAGRELAVVCAAEISIFSGVSPSVGLAAKKQYSVSSLDLSRLVVEIEQPIFYLRNITVDNMLQEHRPGSIGDVAGSSERTKGKLEIVRPKSSIVALGMSVGFLMNDPVFARLPFGSWSGVLAGQINRGHFLFAVEETRVVGFVGWALASEANAEAWLAGTRALTYEQSLDGEMILLNVWKTLTPQAHRLLLDKVRAAVSTKKLIYYKRFYPDGRVRRVRLGVNQFIESHLSRFADGSG